MTADPIPTNHPNYGLGHSTFYACDGEVAEQAIFIVRNELYEFNLQHASMRTNPLHLIITRRESVVRMVGPLRDGILCLKVCDSTMIWDTKDLNQDSEELDMEGTQIYFQCGNKTEMKIQLVPQVSLT